MCGPGREPLRVESEGKRVKDDDSDCDESSDEDENGSAGNPTADELFGLRIKI
jgi:hypothetical protein